MKEKKTRFLTSPFLTGGGGFNFEHLVGAYYLTFLLKKSIPRACQDLGIITKVSFQNQWTGLNVDDLCVYCKRNSIKAKLILQLKHDIIFSNAESNTEFKKVIFDCWETINSSEFNKDFDRVGIGVGIISRNVQKHLKELILWARRSLNCKEFKKKIYKKGFSSKIKQNYYKGFLDLISKAKGERCSSEELWFFFKKFEIIHFEIDQISGRDYLYALNNLKDVLELKPHPPKKIFSLLESIVSHYNKDSGSLNHKKIISELSSYNIKFSEKVNYYSSKSEKEFLRLIGKDMNNWYRNLESNFVDPLNYSKIKSILNNNQILFIIGSPQSGKTFTAVKLMFEYYLRGIKPLWIIGSDLDEVMAKKRRKDCRREFENISNILNSKSIIYFEDPFGKYSYERNLYIEQNLQIIIEKIREIKDVYVIVTSRENIFREFEKEKRINENFQKFIESINLMNPSYDHHKRYEMLCNWARNFGCLWYREQEILNLIKTKIYMNKLPTPLCIRQFANATISITDKVELFEELENKSQELSHDFALTLLHLKRDDQIFFCILYMLQITSGDDLFQIFNDYTKNNEIIDEYIINKFDIFWEKYCDDIISMRYNGDLEFSHASYMEAISIIISWDKGRFFKERLIEPIILFLTRKSYFNKLWIGYRHKILDFTIYFSNFFSPKIHKRIVQLSKNKHNRNYVGWVLTWYFFLISDNLKNLIPKITHKIRQPDRGPEWIISANFKNFPREYQNLLYHHSNKKKTVLNIAFSLSNSYNRIPKKNRIELFKNISKFQKCERAILELMENHYDLFLKDFGEPKAYKILKETILNEKNKMLIIQTIQKNYLKTSNRIKEILFLLLKSQINNIEMGLANPIEFIDKYIGYKLKCPICDSNNLTEDFSFCAEYQCDKIIIQSLKPYKEMFNKGKPCVTEEFCDAQLKDKKNSGACKYCQKEKVETSLVGSIYCEKCGFYFIPETEVGISKEWTF